MKSSPWFSVFAIMFFAIFILACSGNKPAETATESTPTEDTSTADDLTAACIWDQVPVRATPDDKGKFITSLSIGEMVTLSADTAGNGKSYLKVRLIDGTEGYAKKDFIVSQGKASVFTNDADTYSRPEALTKTDKKFSKYDIVAIFNTQDEFLEVKGKRSDGKWIETAWIKNGNLSDDKLNIATAKFIKKAYAETDPAKRAKALQDILDNRDLSGASFYTELQGMVNEGQEDAPADSTSGN